MLNALTAGQALCLTMLVTGVVAYAVTVGGHFLAGRVRRWAYSPRRRGLVAHYTYRVTARDRELIAAMRRHPAGSRR